MDILLSSHIYLLYEILEYLTLKDLLVAAKVCNEFRNVIIKLLKTKYKEVYASKTHYYYIVSNKRSEDFNLETIRSNKFNFKVPCHENRVILHEDDFLEFVKINSENLETLILNFNERYDYDINGIYYDDKEYFSYMKFKQLKTIGFINTNLNESHINEIIRNCPQVREIYCRGFPVEDNDDECLIPKVALDKINIMKHLEYIDVCLVNENYADRQREFIKTEHLLTELTAPTYVTNLIVEDNTKQLNICKVLTERQSMYQPLYEYFKRNTLNNLTNLRKLLIISTTFTDLSNDFFIVLNSSCQHLEYLQLEFCYFKEFAVIKSLKELVLYNCLGLSANDLISILNQYKNLRTFSSTLVRYKGEIKSFMKISESLHHLELRYNEMSNDIMSLLDLRNLTSLHWSACVYDKQTWINGYNFENLQILEIKTSQILFRYLNNFRCLKKLILNISDSLDPNDFWTILHHPTLIYLALNDNPEYDFMNYESHLSEQISNDYSWEISIRFMDICFNNNCKKYFDFWLTLLSINLNLTLRIRPNCHQIESEDDDEIDDCVKVLMEIVYNEMRPSSLKSINVCGYNVDLINIGQNLDETLEDVTLISQDNHFNNKLQYILLKNSK
ncbi:uncharacterized protein ACRADG_000976 isoform 2-T2 [Cochliomyia hominivorax]